ncbi:hypothetical protein [Staphylospora marina]|uniref:hypothetical protein n=1 Tax=Staphylospora marina TaxID=2490858 RepID=UPI000F5BADCA|nr:hypothetical protein [Staphylospora marina]
MNIGAYDPTTNKFVRVHNGVSDIEQKGAEIWFNNSKKEPCFFYARRGNYVVVPNDVPLVEGGDVTPEILAADQKAAVTLKNFTQQQIDQDATLVFLFETLVSKGLI